VEEFGAASGLLLSQFQPLVDTMRISLGVIVGPPTFLGFQKLLVAQHPICLSDRVCMTRRSRKMDLAIGPRVSSRHADDISIIPYASQTGMPCPQCTGVTQHDDWLLSESAGDLLIAPQTATSCSVPLSCVA
jgi:hypothetical protein